MGPSILVLVGVILAFVLLLIGIISANLFICQPSEVLIFSGRTHKGEGDREIGYRVIKARLRNSRERARRCGSVSVRASTPASLARK